MKIWKYINDNLDDPSSLNVDQIMTILLSNRGIKSRKEILNFLHPDINSVGIESSGIDLHEYQKFVQRIEEANKKREKIVIFGDYDVDGICASAILWESLYVRNNNVTPYIPDRVEEGYGLSIKGIDNVLKNHPDIKVIITVDNGIVAFDSVVYAKKKGIDVIITDHHVRKDKLPDAYCVLHTVSLCGAGIAWVIAKELGFESDVLVMDKLELAALATVADLVPLTENNRAIVKEGIVRLRTTKRIGLQALYKQAGLDPESIGVYALGYIIAPRLNASGRIASAMDSLRLLCTKSIDRADELAQLLGGVNEKRQGLTTESSDHAKLLALESNSGKITIVAHESYNQGIIGLIASRMVEHFYRPALVISVGDEVSKGSARSIAGVSIIELLRSVSDTLIETGGHPMAAGFSVKTSMIEEFKIAISKKADEMIDSGLLQRSLFIDMKFTFNLITPELLQKISQLEPFGMACLEPLFATEEVEVIEVRKIGKEQNHLKMKLANHGTIFDAIGFSLAEKFEMQEGDKIGIAYHIAENEWNGRKNIQLKVRDIKLSDN